MSFHKLHWLFITCKTENIITITIDVVYSVSIKSELSTICNSRIHLIYKAVHIALIKILSWWFSQIMFLLSFTECQTCMNYDCIKPYYARKLEKCNCENPWFIFSEFAKTNQLLTADAWLQTWMIDHIFILVFSKCFALDLGHFQHSNSK